MQKQISYISPLRTAKALILIYLTLSVPIIVAGIVYVYFAKGETDVLTSFPSALMLNALLGFAVFWILCHVYNFVAARFGGIEITLSDVPEEL
jgi:hypothetical protein